MIRHTILCIIIALFNSTAVSLARGIQSGRTTQRSIASMIVERDYDEFRSLVLIGVTFKARGAIACGGCYIPPTFVITSAYCAERRASIVVMGVDDTGKPARRKVVQIYKHPCFRSFGHNDIALLKINRPFGRGMQPAPLPIEPNYFLETDKPDLFLASLGRRTNGDHLEPDGTVTNIRLSYTYLRRCREAHIGRLKRKYHVVVDRMHLCGGGLGSVKSCHSARGDPVFADGLLVGLVTKQRGCGRRGTPYVFTRIDTYMPWILGITKIHLR